MLKTLLGNWDRIGTYSCFAAFGVLSMIQPTPSLAGTPAFFSVLFNAQLILAGLLLILAVFTNSFWMRIMGYVIYLIGMLTIAGLILVGSGSPVWVLILGFALQGIISVRYVSRESRVSRELADLAKVLQDRSKKGGA